MEINTKFDVGDKVYFRHYKMDTLTYENTIQSGIVNYIEMKIDKELISIHYIVEYKDEIGTAHSFPYTADKLYSQPSELIEEDIENLKARINDKYDEWNFYLREKYHEKI